MDCTKGHLRVMEDMVESIAFSNSPSVEVKIELRRSICRGELEGPMLMGVLLEDSLASTLAEIRRKLRQGTR